MICSAKFRENDMNIFCTYTEKSFKGFLALFEIIVTKKGKLRNQSISYGPQLALTHGLVLCMMQ